MSKYVKFLTASGEIIYVEIEDNSTESQPTEGMMDASFPQQKKLEKIVTEVENSFDDALSVIKRNAGGFIKNIREIKMSDMPDEVEMSFGLTANGEFNGFVVAKVGVEGNYTVKLTWKKKTIQTGLQ